MLLAIDTETTGHRAEAGARPYYISTCTQEGDIRSWEFDVDPKTRGVSPSPKKTQEIRSYLGKFDGFVFHNAKFDIPMLESIDLSIPSLVMVEDTLLASHVLNNRASHKLKDLALLYLDIDTNDEKAFVEAVAKARKIAKKLGWNIARHDSDNEDGENWMKLDGWIFKALVLAGQLESDHPWLKLMPLYGNTDVERTMGLWLFFEATLKEQGFWEAYQLQKQCFAPIMTMERRGIHLHPYNFISRKDYYEIRCTMLTEELRHLSGKEDYNPSSGPQTAKILYEDRGLPVAGITKGGKPSTDKATLKYLFRTECPDDAFLGKLLAYKKNAKTFSDLRSYEGFRGNGWTLHTSFNPVGTDTTRFSSSSPNMQNISKGEIVDDEFGEVAEDAYEIREVFGPAKGRLWLDFDYSQLQLRIFAAISQEQRMIDAFDQGWDAHDFMACQIYKVDKPDKLQRRTAKNVNFGFIFGAQESKITAVCGDPTVWPTVNKLFPNATKFLETTSQAVRKTGYVELGQPVCNYRLYVPLDYKRGNKPKAYVGVCYKVQGLEGLIVKRALSLWNDRLNAEDNDSFLSLQVHDQLIADIPADQPWESIITLAKDLKRLMEQAGAEFGVKTPADASVVREYWTKSEALSL